MRASRINAVTSAVSAETNAPMSKRPTIVFYSPDLDFCVSLRLLLQGEYEMVTITDPRMLLATAKDFKPELVIVDCIPTESMRSRFEEIRRDNPRVRILSFYAGRFDDSRIQQRILQLADVAFSKPIDLPEVTERIHELVMQHV